MTDAPKKKTAAEKRAEAEAAVTPSEWPKTVKWRDIKFDLEDPEDWPVGIAYDLEQGRVLSALAVLAGPDEWAKIAKLKSREAGELADAMMQVAGFNDAGE